MEPYITANFEDSEVFINLYRDDEETSTVFITTPEKTFKIQYNCWTTKQELKALLETLGLPKLLHYMPASLKSLALISEDPAVMSELLPGINLKAKNPAVKDGMDWRVRDVIISLNDEYKWTREAIAEWLENTFSPEEIAFKGVRNEGRVSEITILDEIKRILPD